MRTNRTLLMVATLAVLTLCVALSARITSAQGPGAPQPPGGGNFPRPGGPPGFGGAPPFAIGTITGGDQNTGRITIQSQFGGNAQTIQVTNTTQIVTQTEVKATALQVNDEVQVQGVPTGITASSITAGQMPDFMPGGGRFRAGGGIPGGPGASAPSAFASATGRITATNPLTVSLGNNVSLTVKPAPNARITKIAPLAFNNLKVGDRVTAMGQAGNDGVFTANSIAVNMDMGFGMGPGMGRGGFGPGGRRGPGGLPPPPMPGAPPGNPNP